MLATWKVAVDEKGAKTPSGGLRHELGNLLGVAYTRACLIEEDLSAGGQAAIEDVKAIKHAAKQAADLLADLEGGAAAGE